MEMKQRYNVNFFQMFFAFPSNKTISNDTFQWQTRSLLEKAPGFQHVDILGLKGDLSYGLWLKLNEIINIMIG